MLSKAFPFAQYDLTWVFTLLFYFGTMIRIYHQSDVKGLMRLKTHDYKEMCKCLTNFLTRRILIKIYLAKKFLYHIRKYVGLRTHINKQIIKTITE